MAVLRTFVCLFLLQWAIEMDFETICSQNNIHALILARGGSKGIKHKNLVKIGGLSLLARTILTVQKSSCFDHIWVSTDDENIALEATNYGAIPHNRPFQYAMDNTTSLAAVKEFLDAHKAILNFSLFQCTSVFLKEKYIKEAVLKFRSNDCVFAVKRSHYLRWNPTDDRLLPANFNLQARPRRQDWQGDLVETGMFYFSKRSLVMNGVLQNERCSYVEIEAEDSLEIDSHLDLKIARCIIHEE